MKIKNLFFLVFLSLTFSLGLRAELVQILHTNDIHSYFDGTDHDHLRGGYANLKKMIDDLKSESLDKGIRSLVVDAGDFMEGTIFYMSEYGLKSFKMHNEMGYDLAVVGNHDYLMGTTDLNKLLGMLDLNFTYLGANINVDSQYKNINSKIVPYKMINVAGHKLAIMGLTTADFLYSWRLYDGKISSPTKTGARLAKKLKKKHGADAVIALTHIGFNSDKKLAKKSPYIDLIIGGHSHDAIKKTHYQKSKKGKRIPIVQAGHHGEYLGRLLVDVSKKGIKVVEYELIPVHYTDEADQGVLELVDQSYQDLYDIYGHQYLSEEVSQSYLKPHSKEAKTIWSFFTADAMRESIDADISVQQENMSGPNYPVGPITNFDLMNAHPRWFDFSDIMGWKVYKAEVSGFLLRSIFKAVMNFGLPLSISGITFDWYKTPWGKYWVKNLRIKGKRVKLFKNYTLALPEGIVRGGLAISPLVGLILKKSERTSLDIVETIKWKLQREGGVGDHYFEREDFKMKSMGEAPTDRLYFPGRAR